MSDIDTIINLSITKETVTVTREGFGVPLFLAYHTHYVDRVRTYSSLKGLTDDGFTTMEPTYKALSVAFSQNPRVAQVKVGRRALPPTQTLKLTMLSSTQGEHVRVTVGATSVDYTILGSATTTTVATAVAALIDADAVAIASASGAVITITTGSAGLYTDVKNWSNNIAVSETTTDPGIATDIAAVIAADSDFYGFGLDNNSKAEVTAAAAVAGANVKIFGYNTSDTDALTSGSTTTTPYPLKTASYDHVYGLYAGNDVQSFSGFAWMCEQFPNDPGSDTWEYKPLKGVSTDLLTDAQVAALEGYNLNYYKVISGAPVTRRGKAASGDWLDVIRGLDWFSSELKTNIFSIFVNSKKVPMTNKGLDQIGSVITSSIREGIAVGLFDGIGNGVDPPYIVNVPSISDISDIDRANRNATGFTFTCRLQGAISTAKIVGTVTV